MQNHCLTTWPHICWLQLTLATVASQAAHPPGQRSPEVNLPILGKDDDFLFGKAGNFNVVNRPPPVIAGLEQTERQNHARSPWRIILIDNDSFVG